MGYHGVSGGNIAGTNFSATGFPENLEERPDFYFWVLSEGRLDKGMPPFRTSLPEEQRWQVLTYLWSLGAAVPPEEALPAPSHEHSGTVQLTVPEPAQSGQPLTLTAVLQDDEGKPIENATIKFFFKVDFFATDLIKIGESVTNAQGVAALVHTPRLVGDVQIITLHQGDSHEAVTMVNLAESHRTATMVNLVESTDPFYQAKAGLPDTTSLPEIFIGPKSTLEPEKEGTAPTTVLRIPGGLPSLLLLAYVFTIILVWSLYFRVWYQMFRIPVVRGIEDRNNRLLPTIGLVTMVVLATLLVFILITGPYSNPHLLR